MGNVLKTVAILIILVTALNAQSNIKINVMGDLNMPADEMESFFEIGYGASAGIAYKISDSWDLGASFGYTKWEVKNDYYSKLATEAMGETVNVEVDMPYTVIPVMLDAYYYFSRENFQPYLLFSLGVHFAKTEINTMEINGKKVILDKTESNTVAGYKFGGGFLYDLSSTIAINLSASMVGNGLEIEQESFDGEPLENVTTTFFNIGLGVSISL